MCGTNIFFIRRKYYRRYYRSILYSFYFIPIMSRPRIVIIAFHLYQRYYLLLSTSCILQQYFLSRFRFSYGSVADAIPSTRERVASCLASCFQRDRVSRVSRLIGNVDAAFCSSFPCALPWCFITFVSVPAPESRWCGSKHADEVTYVRGSSYMRQSSQITACGD